MKMFRGVIERLKALFGRAGFEAELDEELRFHLESLTARYVEQGMTPAEARRKAALDLGNVERTKEQVRDETGVRWVQDLWQDLRFGVRTLLKRPGFATVLIVTVAAAIATNTAVFSVIHGVLLKPLPFPNADRMVRLYNNYPGADELMTRSSARDFYDRQEGIEAFETVTVFTEFGASVGLEDGPRHAFALSVSPSFFDVFGATTVLGGFFPEEVSPDNAAYVVIGHKLWQETLGGRPDVVGSTLMLSGVANIVTGVLSPEFRLPDWDAQVYTPLAFTPEARTAPARGSDNFDMVALVRPGVSVDAVQSAIDGLNAALVQEYPPRERAAAESSGFHTIARGYLPDLTAAVKTPLLLLWLGALVVFIAAAANITTLFLLRASSRRREVACRLAVGAARGRVLRQLITENVLVAVIGGALGVGLAAWSLGFLSAFGVYEIPRIDHVGVGWGVAAAGIGASILIGTVAALAGSGGLLWGKVQPLNAVRTALGERGGRAQHHLVGAQIAFAFVLVMTAGLLLDSLRNMAAVDIGFDAEGVTVGATSLPRGAYPDATARIQFAQTFLDALEARPNVDGAAVVTQLPFSGLGSREPVYLDGIPAADAENQAFATSVSPSYRPVMGMSLIAGRDLQRSDDGESRPVALVDEALARSFGSPEAAVGRRFWFGAERGEAEEAVEIVGVVSTIRQNSITEDEPAGALYVSFNQFPSTFFRIATRMRGELGGGPAQVRDVLTEQNPSLLYFWVSSMEEAVGASILLRRLPMQLLSAFAAVGLFLVIVGVYGVTAHVVAQRRQEIGLRMALGGTSKTITWLLGREWAVVVAMGVVLGVVGTFAAAQVVRGLLFGTGTLDVAVAVLAGGLVVTVAIAAFALPVRRALRIDPAETLAAE